MSKYQHTFVVTHLFAADPDPSKVKAALEIWQMGLAESVMGGRKVQDQQPTDRLLVRPPCRTRRPKAKGGRENA